MRPRGISDDGMRRIAQAAQPELSSEEIISRLEVLAEVLPQDIANLKSMQGLQNEEIRAYGEILSIGEEIVALLGPVAEYYRFKEEESFYESQY